MARSNELVQFQANLASASATVDSLVARVDEARFMTNTSGSLPLVNTGSVNVGPITNADMRGVNNSGTWTIPAPGTAVPGGPTITPYYGEAPVEHTLIGRPGRFIGAVQDPEADWRRQADWDELMKKMRDVSAVDDLDKRKAEAEKAIAELEAKRVALAEQVEAMASIVGELKQEITRLQQQFQTLIDHDESFEVREV